MCKKEAILQIILAYEANILVQDYWTILWQLSD